MQDHRDGLGEQLVEHPVAQQVTGEEPLAERLGRAGEPVVQPARELRRVEVHVIAEGRVANEQVAIAQVGVADQGPHVLLPCRPGGRVQRGIGPHLTQVGKVMVVVAAEQLVGGGAGDRHPIPARLDGLHQQPLHEVADRRHRSIVLAHQRAQPGRKSAVSSATAVCRTSSSHTARSTSPCSS